MGWSLPPGKKWGGPPDWGIVDDPDYPEASPGSMPMSNPVAVAQPPVLDFSEDADQPSAASQRVVAARGRIGNLGATQPDASWNSGGSMDDYTDTYGGSGYGQIEGDYGPGQGSYSVGDQTYDISAPGGGGGGYLYDLNSIYGPTDYSKFASEQRPSYAANFNDPQFAEMASWNPGGGGSRVSSGGGGRSFGAQPTGGGYQQQPYQRVGLGTPERTQYDKYTNFTNQGPERSLYDTYSNLLRNPGQFEQDPGYKFLFNQGMQAFNRTAGAKKMQLAGKTPLEAMQYGQGLAQTQYGQRLGQYGAGSTQELGRYNTQAGNLANTSSQELARFMGPAGLLPGYAGLNNQVSQMQGQDAAAQQLLPYYQNMLSGGGGVSPGAFRPSGAGYGGVTPGGQGYTQRLDPQMLQGLMAGGNEDILTALEDQGIGVY